MATDLSLHVVPSPSEPPRSGDKLRRLRTFLGVFAFFVVLSSMAVGFVVSRERQNQNELRAAITRDVTAKAQAFAARVNRDHTTRIDDITAEEAHKAGARATVIDENGKVIADSEMSIAALDNEGRKPEFQTALRGQIGVQTRSPSQFGIAVLYVAVPVSGGAVRLAYPLADVDIAAAKARKELIAGAFVAALAALIISGLAAFLVSPRAIASNGSSR